jgi:Domain of unknown function (DUF4124)
MNSAVTNIFLGVLILGATAGVRAEIYRWVDENGQVHYEQWSKAQRDSGLQSYKPPSGGGQTPQQRQEQTRKLLDAYTVERQQARARKDDRRQQQEERERNCVLARDKLRQHQRHGSVYRLNKEGEREYLSDTQRHELLQHSRDNVAKWCG